MTDVIVSEVLQELSEKEELLQSIHVSKHLQPEVDLGNLLLNDLDEIDLGNIETNKEEYLLSLNRDNLQYLVNKLYELPTERVDEVIVAKIPEPILSQND
ncbi:ribosome biogenesis regulatory protein homolog [Artemia franciscana]|uniref:ribosome biogenesis regulatory protein homolog n=1 Tax=Artemia franciscana TaxID=6661 RepID=UPI0032DAD6F0